MSEIIEHKCVIKDCGKLPFEQNTLCEEHLHSKKEAPK